MIHLTAKDLNKTGCVNERINVLRVHVPDRLTEMLVGYNDWNASAKLISVVNDLSLVYLADSITAIGERHRYRRQQPSKPKTFAGRKN